MQTRLDPLQAKMIAFVLDRVPAVNGYAVRKAQLVKPLVAFLGEQRRCRIQLATGG